tara:strand:- start:350 stop:859 length:510 start_codon:yes stop_codon:yes gene_type:complete
MTRTLGIALIALGITVGPAHAQSNAVDPFNGTWTLNIEKTKELSGGESPVHEIITFTIGDDNVQHYEVEIQYSDDTPMRKGWYSSKYNEPTFVPYNGTVSDDPPGAEVMTIKVDERTHYRIARTRQGSNARYVMMRRLSEDHQSYISAGIMIDGRADLYRWMDRVPDSE